MEWAWLDLEGALLTVPPEVMMRKKAEKLDGPPRLVPLAPQAVAILRELQALTGGESRRFVFPSLLTGAFIEAQLRLRRNAMAIYQDLVDQHGFAGAYNSVKRFVGKLRHREPEQFDRLAFLPGEEMQVDYGEGALTRVPGTDRWRKPRLFVATLRYSRRSYRCVVWRSSQQVWAQLHEQAWRHFGGSCRYVVLDNLKEGVLKPDLYEPELNPVYAAALAHYGVVADPARVRDPNRKGSVEHAIGHTQATALKGRRFESIEEQNSFLEHWETKWAASRIHGSERRQVQAMFEEEKPHLQPLPLLGMQYFSEAQRTVCDDSCVRVDHSSYAARPAPIGSRVLVRVFEHRIEIRDLNTQALLRTHARAERPGTVVLPDDERVFNPSRETRRILAPGQAIGADAARLCELLFAIEGRVGQRKLWGIVSLAERYPRRLVNSACARALDRGHLQLPPRQGRHREAGRRGTGGHGPRRGRPGAGRTRR